MKLRVEIEGNPFGHLKNTMRTETEFGVLQEPTLEDILDLFINFCLQQGYEIDDIQDVFESVLYSEEEEEENLDKKEDYSSVVDFLEKKTVSRKEDIERIVNGEENRKKFLQQITNNEEMLKEVFRLYLKDTLEISFGRE